MLRYLTTGALLCAGLVFPAALLFAENIEVLSVKQKPNPDFDPKGGKFKALIVKPALEIEELYDDNIFRDETGEQGDFITSFKPEVKVSTDWNLHQIETGASADVGRYWDHEAENFDDYAVYLSGRYDVDYGTYVTASARFDHKHEDRGALDDVSGDSPIEYDVATANLGFTRDLSVLKLYMKGTWRALRYQETQRNGTTIDNSERDRDQSIYEAKLAYEMSDRTLAYAQVRYDRKRYELDSESFRNSDGFDYRLGMGMDISGKVHGDIYAGYLKTSYDDVFDDIGAANYGGALLWNLSEITSVRVSAERSVVETTLDGSSGIVRTKAGLGLEHAFRQNIIADMRFSITDDAYEGNAAQSSTRDNRTYDAGFGLDYMLSDQWKMRFDYNLIRRDFDTASGDYNNNKIMLALKYSY